MLTYLLFAFGILAFGYFVFSKLISSLMEIDTTRGTTVFKHSDESDFIRLDTQYSFLYFLLSTSGPALIIGGLMAAAFGPSVMIWIAVGATFLGAPIAMAYGVLSARNSSRYLPEILGAFTNVIVKYIWEIVCFTLLMFVIITYTLQTSYLLSNNFSLLLSISFIVGLYLFNKLSVQHIAEIVYPYLTLIIFLATALYFWSALQADVSIVNKSIHASSLSVPLILIIVVSSGFVSGISILQITATTKTIGNERAYRTVFYGGTMIKTAFLLLWVYVGIIAINMSGLTGFDWNGVINSTNEAFKFKGFIKTLIPLIGILGFTKAANALRSQRAIIQDRFKLHDLDFVQKSYILVPIVVVACVMVAIINGLSWTEWLWEVFMIITQWVIVAIGITIIVFIFIIKKMERWKTYWYTLIPILLIVFALTYATTMVVLNSGINDINATYSGTVPLVNAFIVTGIAGLLITLISLNAKGKDRKWFSLYQ